jgi:N-acetyl-anhydromuramyl-L-alanine amidase AmpD
MPDEIDALWVPNTNFFPERNGFQPRYVIIHGTAGFTSAKEVAYFFKASETGPNPVSTHYILGLEGQLAQCVDERDAAWGNGYVMEGHDPWWSLALNPNLITISIEHVKLSRDNSDELTPLQKAASFRLVKNICLRHSIPTRWADPLGGITGHFSMDPVNRSFCPGPYPWDELFSYLSLP